MKHIEPIFSVCTYCGTGCEIAATVSEGVIQKIEPPKNSSVSRGKLCIKGREGYEFLTSKNRIKAPRIKKSFLEKNPHLKALLKNQKEYNADYIECDYASAVKVASTKLQEIKKRYGSDSICGIGGARSSCEGGYAFQKFIRECIGSKNIDNCARVCHAPSLNGLKHAFGEGASANPFDDILEAEFIMIIGSNTTEAHPIVANRVLEAHKNGATLCTIEVRETAILKKSNFQLITPPEANLLVLNMMAQVIIKEKLYDKKFVKTRCEEFKAYKKAILKDKWANPNIFKKIEGYEHLALQIKEAARSYASSRSLILWGLGVSEHIDGSYAVSAIAHLAMLTGNIGGIGKGVIPLRGQNNVQGSCDVGCMPNYLPDYVPIKQEGLKSIDMFEEASKGGNIKAIYNIGEDITHIHANQNKIESALQNLELLVTQEIADASVVRVADIVFGVKSQYEKKGVYVNAERRLHLSSPIVESALPDDWEVVRDIAKELGVSLGFESQEELWEEARHNITRFKGASYEKLEADINGLQWPVHQTHDTPRLYEKRFHTDSGLARFRYAQYKKRGFIKSLLKGKTPTLTLVTGRTIHHYNNASQTKECDKLIKAYSGDVLHLSHEDFRELGGTQKVILESKYGRSGELEVKESKGLKKGVAFCTFHFEASRINYLFGDEGDLLTKTSRFKAVEVKIRVV